MKSHVWVYYLEQAKTVLHGTESLGSLDSFKDAIMDCIDLSRQNDWNEAGMLEVENNIEQTYREKLISEVIRFTESIPENANISSLEDCRSAISLLARCNNYRESLQHLESHGTLGLLTVKVRQFFLSALSSFIDFLRNCELWSSDSHRDAFNIFRLHGDLLGITIPENLNSWYSEALVWFEARQLLNSIDCTHITNPQFVSQWLAKLENLKMRWWDDRMLNEIENVLDGIQEKIRSGELVFANRTHLDRYPSEN